MAPAVEGSDSPVQRLIIFWLTVILGILAAAGIAALVRFRFPRFGLLLFLFISAYWLYTAWRYAAIRNRHGNFLRILSRPQGGERPQILLATAQDTGDLAAGLCELMQGWGYSPTAVSGIGEIKRQLRIASYDLLIVDLCDPDYNLPPDELLRLHPLILFLCCEEDMHRRLIPPGYLAVAAKPVDVTELSRKLREMLQGEESLSEAANPA